MSEAEGVLTDRTPGVGGPLPESSAEEDSARVPMNSCQGIEEIPFFIEQTGLEIFHAWSALLVSGGNRTRVDRSADTSTSFLTSSFQQTGAGPATHLNNDAQH
jgi:hypothetical protein